MGKISHELYELKRIIIRLGVVFLVVFVGFFTLTTEEYAFFGKHIPFLAFGEPSLATKLLLSAKSFLVPADVPVVALGPVSSFTAPITMAFLVTLLIIFPYALYSLVLFLRPALYQSEKRSLYSMMVPALVLFYLGCTLAYFVIIPKTFAILYSFAVPIGIAPLFALDDFISSVFLITLMVGLAFLLPIVMAILTRLGVVPRGFWLGHWRIAIVCIVIFSAVVTPDGSGVTMVFLSVPMAALYGAGAVAYAPLV